MSFTRVTVVEGEPREPSWLWWVIVLVGVLSAVAGIILVFKPSDSLTTLAVIFGIFLLIDGIGELIASIAGTTDSRGLAAIIGVLGVIVGIALIRHPFHGVTAIGLLIGIWLVAAGIVRLVRSLVGATRSPPRRARRAARGVRRNRGRVRPPHRLRDARDPDRDLADRQRDRHDRTRHNGPPRRAELSAIAHFG